jgi:hypothetical protein
LQQRDRAERQPAAGESHEATAGELASLLAVVVHGV